MRTALVLACAAGVLAGCSGGPSGAGTVQVVAAENIWGSIAAQLGGGDVDVESLVTSPATDPHDYEPTAADARAIAGANLVIVNGVGYDPWASKLVAASPAKGRIVLNVGDLVGVAAGGNPHRWYSPADVHRVAGAIARDYATLAPKHAGAFRKRLATFERRGLGEYSRLIATIKRHYAGVRVGASESIFVPLAQALGLDLVTPRSFLKAISEGAEPTARDKTTIDRQVARRQIAVWVFNRQNSTPDVQRVTESARAHGIPIVTITETLVPATATFQSWQVRELGELAAALARVSGR